MKRIVNPLGLAILLGWGLNPGPSSGYQGPNGSDDAKIRNRNHQQRNKPGRSGPAAKGKKKRGSSKEDPRQLMRDITKLHEAMTQRIELSIKQMKAIDGLFREHLKQLRKPTRGRRSGEPEEATAESTRELREQLAAARKSGDEEAVKKIREQVRALKGQRAEDAGESTSLFIQEVADQLTQEQKQSFQRILKRLKLDRFGERRGAALRGLMRAIHNRQVKLSDEQKRAIRELTKETFKSAGVEGRSGEMADQVTAELQAKILAKLTVEQRATVEQLLKSDQPNADRAGGKGGKNGNRPGKDGNRPGKG